MSANTTEKTGIEIAAHTVMPPDSISPEAQHFLSMAAQLPDWQPFPAAHDHDAWRQWAAELDALTRRLMVGRDISALVDSETVALGGVDCHIARPKNSQADLANHVYLDIHGGALIVGGGDICAYTGMATSLNTGMKTVAVDYRMPPDHPYPAALDDCLGVYLALLEHYPAQHIIVGGLSAGGNLAAALMLRLRDEGIELPAGLALLSPELDLTESGDSFQVIRPADVGLRYSLMPVNALYANGQDLREPYLSPLFGDFSRGFPRTFLQAGTRDVFLSNVARMHRALRRASIDVELHLFEAMPHAGFFGAPEDQELAMELRRFCRECLSA